MAYVPSHGCSKRPASYSATAGRPPCVHANPYRFVYLMNSPPVSRIVYAASSGFGRTGPYRRKPCMDPIAQAISGLTSISGAPDGEGEKLRFVLADFFS